ncbi:MAG: protein phosphatase 2C domain-containing protein [Dehalococcoidia bacterium]|nr:protein phosphatase 2C domain-containing protein [Dehalococcoidia bacterium]MDD5494189.1 protein phosphatase 2C domain-containing protein [Dehalococcoidia bacterium]
MKLHYKAAGLSDIGRVREENQDAFYIDIESGLFMVVDGMGGMQEGALAAKYVVEGLPSVLTEQINQQGTIQSNSIISSIKEAVAEVSSYLREKVGNNTGATFASALVKGGKAYVAHLGDSRAYLLRDGNMEQLTKDHNVASLLVDMGEITADQAGVHPMRHRLTAYIGMQDSAVPEIKCISLEAGDVLLLCTDGLTGMLPVQEITDILSSGVNLKSVLEKLIDRANEAGGQDNITAVLINFQERGEG